MITSNNTYIFVIFKKIFTKKQPYGGIAISQIDFWGLRLVKFTSCGSYLVKLSFGITLGQIFFVDCTWSKLIFTLDFECLRCHRHLVCNEMAWYLNFAVFTSYKLTETCFNSFFHYWTHIYKRPPFHRKNITTHVFKEKYIGSIWQK
jgi:hypothetical protein